MASRKRSFHLWLCAHDACHSAVAWVGQQTVDQAWESCDDPGWLYWLIHKIPATQEIGRPYLRGELQGVSERRYRFVDNCLSYAPAHFLRVFFRADVARWAHEQNFKITSRAAAWRKPS